MAEQQSTHHSSVPKRFGERIPLLVCSQGALTVHRGERTGLPVVFSRMSDVLQLCDVRNRNTCTNCGVVSTADVELLLIEATEELIADYVRRMRHLSARNMRRKGVAHVS